MSWIRPENEYEALVYVLRRLAEHFPTIDEERIGDVVADELIRFDGARIRQFVPMLVEGNAARRLRAEIGLAA